MRQLGGEEAVQLGIRILHGHKQVSMAKLMKHRELPIGWTNMMSTSQSDRWIAQAAQLRMNHCHHETSHGKGLLPEFSMCRLEVGHQINLPGVGFTT